MSRERAVILWAIWGLVVLVVFICLAIKASGHPMPKLPAPPLPDPPKKRVVAQTQGDGGLLLIKREPKTIPRPPITLPQKINLAWDWHPTTNNPESNVVFLVRRLSTNQYAPPSTNWPVIAVLTSRSYTQDIDKTIRMALFTVTASNTATHLESGFATK